MRILLSPIGLFLIIACLRKFGAMKNRQRSMLRLILSITCYCARLGFMLLIDISVRLSSRSIKLKILLPLRWHSFKIISFTLNSLLGPHHVLTYSSAYYTPYQGNISLSKIFQETAIYSIISMIITFLILFLNDISYNNPIMEIMIISKMVKVKKLRKNSKLLIICLIYMLITHNRQINKMESWKINELSFANLNSGYFIWLTFWA